MNLNIEKIIHLNLSRNFLINIVNTGIHDRVFCKIMSKNWESLKQLYLSMCWHMQMMIILGTKD